MKVKSESEVAQSCPTLSDPMDCSPPGSSVHGVFQARALEWGATAFSSNSAVRFIVQPYLEGVALPGNSVGKESACNAEDPGSIPGLESSPGEGIGYPFQYSWASLVAQMVKTLHCYAGDMGSTPGLGRSPGEGYGNPLQYSFLENPMDRGAWWAIVHGVPKSQTQLSD